MGRPFGFDESCIVLQLIPSVARTVRLQKFSRHERASHVLLRRLRSCLSPDPRQSFRSFSPRRRHTAPRRISSRRYCLARGSIRTCCRCRSKFSSRAISPARAAPGSTHIDVPSTPDTEKTFEDLRQRLAKTSDYVKTFTPAQFEGADSRDVTFPAGPDKTLTLKGQEVPQSLCISEFLLPRRDRPRHSSSQWRRDRQAGFSRRRLSRRRQRIGVEPANTLVPGIG